MNADRAIEWITHVLGIELTAEQERTLRENFEDGRSSGCQCHSSLGFLHEDDGQSLRPRWISGNTAGEAIMDSDDQNAMEHKYGLDLVVGVVGKQTDEWATPLETKAHAEMQSEQVDNIAAVMARLLKENTALQKQIEDARDELSRGVLDLIVTRPEQTLAEVVAEVVKEFRRTATVGEGHVCECDCESAEELEEMRDGIKSIMSDLEGLL